MTRYFLLAIFSLSSCAADSDVSETSIASYSGPVGVYLIAGQSNAVGGAKGVDLSSGNMSYLSPYAPVQQAQELNCPKDGSFAACNLIYDWQDLKPRGGTQVFGVELSLGRRLDERFGEVGLIKHATNGSSLYIDWDSTTPSYHSLYQYMIDFVDLKLPALPSGSAIAGVFWIQGNADATALYAAQDYAENLAWLILRLREEYGCVPVVLDRLSPFFDDNYDGEVRSEQDYLASIVDDVYVVDTSDLPLRDVPPVHYTADSMIALGTRMADVMPACP